MPLAQAVIAFDLSDFAGVDFDSRRTKVYATNNVPGGAVIDTDGNKIYLGSGNATINTDGTGSITVPVPGTGSNPETWQTSIHVDYPDRNSPRGRATRTFGPFTIMVDADLADLVEQQEIPPTYITLVTQDLDGYVLAASAASQSSAASATSAAASAAAAASIADIDTPDALVETLIETPSSLTATALSATIEAAVTTPGDPVVDFNDARYASAIPEYLEGVPVTVQGHSWTTDPGRYTAPGMDWQGRLRTRRYGTFKTYGISGQTMMELAFSVVGDDWYTGVTGNTASAGNDRTFDPGTLGVAVVQCTLNDGTRPYTADAKFQNGYKNALRTVLAALTCGQRIEAEAGTVSGTWNDSFNKQVSGGKLKNSPTAGAGASYIEWANVTVPTGVTKVYVCTYVSDAAATLGLLNVSVDGVAQVTAWDPGAGMYQYTTPLGTNPSVSLAVIPVTVTAGTRTIRVTHAAGRATAAFVDCLMIPAQYPPLVILCKEPPVTASGYAAKSAQFNGYIDTIAAEFPSSAVKVVDLGVGWDNATMLGPDGLHANAKGARHVADAIDGAIRSAITDYRIGVTHKIV